MFGSNFDANFGIPAFPLQGMDPQGGMLGTNIPPDPNAGPAPQTAPPPAAPPSPAGPAALGASPLGGGPLAPSVGGAPANPPGATGGPPETPAAAPPAAGIGSPFGKPAS